MSQLVDLSPRYVAPVADALRSCGVFDIPQTSSSHIIRTCLYILVLYLLAEAVFTYTLS